MPWRWLSKDRAMGSYKREKELKALRLSQGMCQVCGTAPHRPQKKTCIFCAMHASGRGSPFEQRQLSKGFCRKCGKLPHARNKTMCDSCLEKCRFRALRYYRAKKIPALSKVLDHYGRRCACCGETEPLFLTIDHMNNDGASHRKVVGSAYIAQWLVENEFPEGFQLLCFNCNCGRQRNGGVCPHHGKENKHG